MPNLGIDFLITIALVLASGFCSFSETCVTVCEPKKIDKPDTLISRLLKKLLSDKAQVVTTILLVNTLVNVFISSIISNKFISWLNNDIFIAGIVSTLVILIFGEILPKAFAFARPQSGARKIALPIYFFTKLFYPITFAVYSIIKLLIKSSHSNDKNQNVMEMIHDLLSYSGSVSNKKERESLRMIEGIRLLHDIKISQIMIHRTNVFSIDMNLDLDLIIKRITKTIHSRIPLMRDDDIIGILYIKDFFREYFKNSRSFSKERLMAIASKPTYVLENTSLYSQLNRFLHEQKHMIAVMDEYSSYIGILTLEDIIETIIGSIDDEYDKSIELLHKETDGSFSINGELLMRDFARQTNFAIEDFEDYSTVANLVIEEIERLPEKGEEISIGNCIFIIKKIASNKIIRMNVRQRED